MPQSLESFLLFARERVDHCLDQQLPKSKAFDEAVRYCVFNGGKRVRPALVYATAESLGISAERVDGIAVAIELIHAYSLVHDDLPAMDDDELRRGKPTCHIAYDEATAILVGDALQCYAFQALAERVDTAHIPTLIKSLAGASGARGMILGQVIDIEAEGKRLTESDLEEMHRLKTGALIDASVLMPAQLSELNKTSIDALANYSRALGLAFQIQDDILDVISDTQTLGKPSGSDEAKSKPTYTSIMGLSGAREKLAETHRTAIESLDQVDADTSLLESIANYIIERVN